MPQRALSELLALCVVCALALTGAAAPALAATTVGDAEVVVKSVSGALGDEVRALVPQDEVFQDERIETGAKSATEITFLDGTTLTMGERSDLTLTEVVFDADPDSSRVVLTAIEGVFKFVSGNLRPEAYEVRTPVATIGIRGTVFTLVVDADGTTTVTAMRGEVRVANAEGASTTLGAPGLSSMVLPRRSGEDLRPPSPPGPPPPIVTARVRQMDTAIARGRDIGAASATGETVIAGTAGDGDGPTGGTSAGGGSTSTSMQAGDGGGGEGGGENEVAGRPKKSDRRQARASLTNYNWEILGLSVVLAFFVYRELGSSEGANVKVSAVDHVKTFITAWSIVWIFFGLVFLGLYLLNQFGVIRLRLV